MRTNLEHRKMGKIAENRAALKSNKATRSCLARKTRVAMLCKFRACSFRRQNLPGSPSGRVDEKINIESLFDPPKIFEKLVRHTDLERGVLFRMSFIESFSERAEGGVVGLS